MLLITDGGVVAVQWIDWALQLDRYNPIPLSRYLLVLRFELAVASITSSPGCLSSVSRDTTSQHLTTHHIQGEECIYLDESVQISENNGDWNEPNIQRITVKMWDQLNNFGDNEPHCEADHDKGQVPVGDFLGSFEEKPSQDRIHYQGRWAKGREVQRVKTPRLLPTEYMSGPVTNTRNKGSEYLQMWRSTIKLVMLLLQLVLAHRRH